LTEHQNGYDSWKAGSEIPNSLTDQAFEGIPLNIDEEDDSSPHKGLLTEVLPSPLLSTCYHPSAITQNLSCYHVSPGIMQTYNAIRHHVLSHTLLPLSCDCYHATLEPYSLIPRTTHASNIKLYHSYHPYNKKKSYRTNKTRTPVLQRVSLNAIIHSRHIPLSLSKPSIQCYKAPGSCHSVLLNPNESFELPHYPS
jgi:hypothetical protein